MKVFTGILLLYFAGFLCFVQLSSQMNYNQNGGQGGNNNNQYNQPHGPRLVTMRTRTILQPKVGARYLLPNGNVYRAHENGPISMFYNVGDETVTVQQPTGSRGIVIPRGNFQPAPLNNWSGTFTYTEQ